MELTEAEKDLGPCLCCKNPQLGRWQVVYEGEEVIGALCFDCYCVACVEDERLKQMLKYNKKHPNAKFCPS